MSDDKEALFKERLATAMSMFKRPTDEQFEAFAKAEEACICKHCGRCVMAGPPCCYDAVYELYNKAQGEVLWYRKVVSKKDKKINELKKQLTELQEKIK